MRTLEDALLKIMDNPEKYIGRKSIGNLHHFIRGYVLSQLKEDGTWPEWRSSFSDYVQEKYGIQESVSIAGIIRLFSGSDEVAFDKYFDLLQEFHKNQLEGNL